MSLDFEFAPIDVGIMTHPKACLAGPEAMGLWLWGQTYCKFHGSGGRVHRPSVLVAWGGKRNIMLAKRLVDAGLWLARDDGDWDVYNFEKKSPGSRTRGSETPKSSTERVRAHRSKKKGDAPLRVTDETETETDETRFRNGNGSTSYSSSVSVSGEVQEGRSPPAPSAPVSEVTPAGTSEPPGWWAGAVGAAEQVVGAVPEPRALWVQYDASRERKGWARNHRDAVGWLTAVVRGERDRSRASPRTGLATAKQTYDLDAPWAKAARGES